MRAHTLLCSLAIALTIHIMNNITLLCLQFIHCMVSLSCIFELLSELCFLFTHSYLVIAKSTNSELNDAQSKMN